MGGKPRRPPERQLILRACPRVAPLGWPCSVFPESGGQSAVLYQWVIVKPDGSGWTKADDSLEHAFPESRLDDVLEAFYEHAGPYPFDFNVTVVAGVPGRRRSGSPRRRRGARRRSSST